MNNNFNNGIIKNLHKSKNIQWLIISVNDVVYFIILHPFISVRCVTRLGLERKKGSD